MILIYEINWFCVISKVFFKLVSIDEYHDRIRTFTGKYNFGDQPTGWTAEICGKFLKILLIACFVDFTHINKYSIGALLLYKMDFALWDSKADGLSTGNYNQLIF